LHFLIWFHPGDPETDLTDQHTIYRAPDMLSPPGWPITRRRGRHEAAGPASCSQLISFATNQCTPFQSHSPIVTMVGLKKALLGIPTL